MPTRNYNTLSVDLSKLTGSSEGTPYPVAGAILYVLPPSTVAPGVEFAIDDSSQWVPLLPILYKFQTPDGGEPFQTIRFRGTAQAGAVAVLSGDNPIPLLNATPGGGASDVVGVDLWYRPELNAAAGSNAPTRIRQARWVDTSATPPALASVASGTGAAFKAYFNNGLVKIQTSLGAGPGVSAFYVDAFAVPWVRSLVSANDGDAQACGTDALEQVCHIEVEFMSSLATPGATICGLFITPSDGAAANDAVPWGGVNPPIFGLLSDGADTWRFRSRHAQASAAWDIDDDVTALVSSGYGIARRVVLRLQSADAKLGTEGMVTLLVDGVPVKVYTDMSKFPYVTANGVASYSFRRLYCGAYYPGAGGKTNLFVSNLHVWTSKGPGTPQAGGF